MTTTFADRLRAARHRAELSQEQLAYRAGLSKAAISKIEAGLTQETTMVNLYKFSDILRVDARWLATGSTSTGDTELPAPVIHAAEALERLPADLKEPILRIINSAIEQQEKRFFGWAKETSG